MPVRRGMVMLAATLVTAGCGSDEAPTSSTHDAGGDVVSDAALDALVCPDVATTCPDGCTPLIAFGYDTTMQCVAPHLEVVGCVADASATGPEGCVMRAIDQVLFRAATAAWFDGLSDWSPCDPDAGATVNGAPRCNR